MTDSPLAQFISFWKPLMSDDDLRALATYRSPDEAPAHGINVYRADSKARSWRVLDGADSFRVFAAVQAIDEVPPAAEVIADIVDDSGAHRSYVLWLPLEDALILPFDPNAAIESFRREAYVSANRRTALPAPLLNLYYAAAKPLMPRSIKLQLRRSMARRSLVAEGALQWPTDESTDSLQRFLMRLVLLAAGRTDLEFTWFWPDGHPWATILTHDVESADGLPNIEHVADLEVERGLRSSFNFVPLDYEVPESILTKLRGAGFEIGVHGYRHDGLLFSSWSNFRERVGTVNEFVRRWGASGFRSPATYRNPAWYHLLECAYDSSFSNSAPCEPQPGGCGSFFPYPIASLVELPITLPQDHTLFELLEQTDTRTWLTTLERIERAGGMACVLTHPDPGVGYLGSPANETRYVELLDAVAASSAWTPLPRDLARWWRAREATPAETIHNLAGASRGRAVLDAGGTVEIVPPSRGAWSASTTDGSRVS